MDDNALKALGLRKGLKGWGRFIDGFVWGIGDDPLPPEPKGVSMVITGIDYGEKIATLNTSVRHK